MKGCRLGGGRELRVTQARLWAGTGSAKRLEAPQIGLMAIPGPDSHSLERTQLWRGTGSLGAAWQVDSKTNALLTMAAH